MEPRSYLFVPGNRPERFAKAFASGADAVVLDLEDAVTDDAKAAARDAIAAWAAHATDTERARCVVRINGVASAHVDDDLKLLSSSRLSDVMLPKAESDHDLAAVRSRLPSARLLPLIESACGVAAVAEVARGTGVVRLVFGTLDFALDLDLDITAGNAPLAHAAGQIAIASRTAGLPTPVAGVTPQLDDDARLLSDLAWWRRHGFHAKLCIHPRQVPLVHAALMPSEGDLAWARRVLAAEAASPGAARLDGRMVDRPVVLQAERALRRAGL